MPFACFLAVHTECLRDSNDVADKCCLIRWHTQVTTSLRRFMEKINGRNGSDGSARALQGRTCFITHASRVDLIMGLHTHARDKARASSFDCGLILSCSEEVELPGKVQFTHYI
jgi:hypothetical protein